MLSGYVCLIGAGPGNPGLISELGLKYLKRAEVVLYDNLVPVQLLLATRPECELIDVGKQCGKHSCSQETINQLLIAKAREGKFVVRLKGGDVFLFGRGGEETEALVAAGIPYLIVPGISSALSVPAYAGIPVTHRQVAHGMTIRTGHHADSTVNEGQYTQVILMSLQKIREVTVKLIGEGYPDTTPVAVISKGTTVNQRVVTGTLANIELLVNQRQLATPALMVVGEAVALEQTLAWCSNLPLSGRRILWTRPEQIDDRRYLDDFELLGAEVVKLPLFSIHSNGPAYLEEMIAEIVNYHWVILTSRNAVAVFSDALIRSGRDWRDLVPVKIAVVGERTAAELHARGRIPELIAKEGNSKGLLTQLVEILGPGDKVAVCQAQQTLPYLADGLAAMQVDFRQFVLYQQDCRHYPESVIRKVFDQSFDWVVFTAPSAVKNYLSLHQMYQLVPAKDTKYACLGRETASVLEANGYQVALIPQRHSVVELLLMVTQRLKLER